MPEIVVHAKSVDDLINKMGQQLGQGVYGAVFSFKDDDSRVIKEISISDMNKHDIEVLEEGIVTLMTLYNPRIIKYEYAYKSDNAIYIVMPRYTSSLDSTLKTYKRNNKNFSTFQVVNVARKIGSALKYLHNPKSNSNDPRYKKIIHGDIKLANILVNQNETEFILSDLGFGDKNAMTMQTYCVAPEVLLGRELTPASDMWGLGIVLYEISTGSKPPFLGNNQPSDVYVPGWEPDLSAIKDVTIKSVLEHLLVLNPKDRLTATDLIQVLESMDNCSAIKNALKIRRLETKLKETEVKVERLMSLLIKTGTFGTLQPDDVTMSSPLIDATICDNLETVTTLVESGIYNREADSSGMTALMHAAARGSAVIVASLIEHEKGMRNKLGESAMMIAAKNGHDNIVGLLAEYEHGLRNNEGKTAKQLAQEAGHHDVVGILSEYSDE